MHCRALLLLLMTMMAPAAMADEHQTLTRIADDVYLAGSDPEHAEDDAEDLFIAGDSLRVSAPVTGTAHMAGRTVEALSDIAGDVYAAAMDLTIAGDIGGDATLAGYDIRVGSVGGDLRATAARLRLNGLVGGYALLAADELTLDSAVAGDLFLSADEVNFGPGARVDGRLLLYEAEPGTLEVPARVAPEDRVERREQHEWQHDVGDYAALSWAEILGRFVLGLAVVALLAGLAAALVPAPMAALRRRLLETPWRALWIGFLGQSAVVGSGFILALTGIGILLLPAVMMLAGLLGLAGYIVGVYAFGVGLLHMLGRAFPKHWRDRAMAAVVGAVTVGLLGLVPLLGWIFVLALSLAGVGAILSHGVRPRFFV